MPGAKTKLKPYRQKNKPMKKVLLFLLILFSISVVAQDESNVLIPGKGEKKIITTGYGETAEKALDNALRNAVEEATGAYIASSSTIENDELVEDKVLSLSRGFIKDYRKLSETKIDEEYKIVVSALVTEKQILEAMEAEGIKVEYKTASVFEQYQAWDNIKNDELELAKELFSVDNNNHGIVFDYQIRMEGPKRQGDNYKVRGNLEGRSNSNYEIEFQNLKNILSELAAEAVELKYTMPMSYTVSPGSSATVTYSRYMFKTYYKNKKGKIKSDSKSVDLILPELEQKIIGERAAFSDRREAATIKFVGNQEANPIYGLFFKKYEKTLTQEDKNRLNDSHFDRYDLVYDFFDKDFSPYMFIIMEGSTFLSDAKYITCYKFVNKETLVVLKNYMASVFEDNHCKVVYEMKDADNLEFIPDAYFCQLFSLRSDLWSDKASILYDGYIFFKRDELNFTYPVEKVLPADEFKKILNVSVEPFHD